MKTVRFLNHFNIRPLSFVVIALGLLFPTVSHAASLYFSPGSGTYTVGQDFSVSVYVSTPDQAMNAAQGVIGFPSDRLQVTSLGKAGSIMSLWVQEPSFSNAQGAVNFEGIVLNPGYTGSNGKILTINFKVKAAGSGTLSFTSGSVLANDGQGTNIVSGLSSANFSLVATIAPGVPETSAPVPATNTPSAPVVSSTSHPDQTKWYSNVDPTFAWSLPRGTTGVNVLANREPNADPGNRSDGVMTSYTFNDVDPGTWYFHIKFQNNEGWGAVTHFVFNIDTEQPESPVVKQVTTEPASKIAFEITAKDAVSDIERYEIIIDNNEPVTWVDDSSHYYTTPSLEEGSHTITVKAIDKAGNSSESTRVTFESSDTVSLPQHQPLETSEPIAVRGYMSDILIIAVPSFFFLIVLFLLLYHIWRKLHDTKKRLRKEIRNVETSIHDAFRMLHGDMKRHLKLLESAQTKRDLTREEEKILAQMKRDIDMAEKMVSKEIKDMKEEIE